MLVVALVWPLSPLWGAGPSLLGWSGEASGEFESWWWLDWWIPRLAAARWDNLHGHPLQQFWSLLCIPRDLDIGNYVEGLLLALPCKTWLGPIQGHNLHVALVLLLNVEAALFLAKSFLALACPEASARPWRIGLVTAAAVAMALNPVTLWDLAQSRFGQALIAPWLLLLAFSFEAVRHGSRTVRAGVAVTLALTAVVYWYAAFFAAALVLPLLVLAARQAPAAEVRPPKRAWLGLALALAAGLVATLPLGIPFLAGGPAEAPAMPFPPLEDLVARGIPGAAHLGPPGPPLIVAQSVDLLDPLRAPGGPALSWMWAALGALGLLLGLARPSMRPVTVALLLALLAWMVVAFGPYARTGDAWHPLALPYQLLYRWLPFFWRLNWPARTLPFVHVGLVLLSLQAAALTLRVHSRRNSWATGTAALAMAVLALLPSWKQDLLPLPSTPVQVPAFYAETVAHEEPGGVIEASFDWNSSRAGFFQVWHEQKVLGNLAHCPPAFGDPQGSSLRTPSSLRQHPLLRTIEEARLETPSLDADSPGAALVERDLTMLKAARYRWIVVHASYGGAPIPRTAALLDAISLALGRHPDVHVGDLSAWKLY